MYNNKQTKSFLIMKANKFFAVAMAALALVACKPQGGNEPDPKPEGLTVTPDKAELEVGGTVTLEANVATVAWTAVSSTNSVELSASTGKSIVVTAKAAGAASVIATSGENQVIVSIKVNGSSGPSSLTIEASEIYPVFLDQEVWDANAAKMKYDWRPDEGAGKNLFIWKAGETYNAGDGTGKSYFGLTNGYTSLTVAAPEGWSGGGLNLAKQYIPEMNDLIAKIKAEPDKYFLHIGIKSTDNAVHKLYVFGNGDYHIVLGATPFVDNGKEFAPFCDFARTGAWQGIDFPMSTYAAKLPTISGEACDIFSFLSGATVGAQLNLDAVYFYKK